MADWLVQVHTLNAFVVITKTLTQASEASFILLLPSPSQSVIFKQSQQLCLLQGPEIFNILLITKKVKSRTKWKKKKHFQCFNIFVGSKNHYGFEM